MKQMGNGSSSVKGQSPVNGNRVVAIGEVMIELSTCGEQHDCWKAAVAGDTFNTAWYLRAFLPKTSPVSYFTALGHDHYSQRILDFMRESGIDDTQVLRMPGRNPGIYAIHQENGDRRFTYWRNESAAKLMASDVSVIESCVEGAGLIYFSGITLAILEKNQRGDLLSVIVRSRSSGSTVAFDPNIRADLWQNQAEIRAALAAAAEVSDIVFPTFDDERHLFGDIDGLATAARYAALGAKEVVVKDGGRPVSILCSNQAIAVPPSRVSVVDATGAGDSFNAAYLARRLAGHSPREAAEFGHRVAGICVRHVGALVPRDTLSALS